MEGVARRCRASSLHGSLVTTCIVVYIVTCHPSTAFGTRGSFKHRIRNVKSPSDLVLYSHCSRWTCVERRRAPRDLEQTWQASCHYTSRVHFGMILGIQWISEPCSDVDRKEQVRATHPPSEPSCDGWAILNSDRSGRHSFTPRLV